MHFYIAFILFRQFTRSSHYSVFWLPLIPYYSTNDMELSLSLFLYLFTPNPCFIPKASKNHLF